MVEKIGKIIFEIGIMIYCLFYVFVVMGVFVGCLMFENFCFKCFMFSYKWVEE